MNSPSELKLLERLRQGTDPMAWDDFFRRYWRILFNFAKSMGCSDHTASDAVQTAMMELVRQGPCFCYDPALGPLRSWLWGLTRHVVSQLHRSKTRRLPSLPLGPWEQGYDGTSSESPPEKAVEDTFELMLLAVLLDMVRAEVEPTTYQAFELLTLQGLSGDEVGRIVGLKRQAVYSAVARVKKRLLDLGAPYADDGQLGGRVKEALLARPSIEIERSLTTWHSQTQPSPPESPS